MDLEEGLLGSVDNEPSPTVAAPSYTPVREWGHTRKGSLWLVGAVVGMIVVR